MSFCAFVIEAVIVLCSLCMSELESGYTCNACAWKYLDEDFIASPLSWDLARAMQVNILYIDTSN